MTDALHIFILLLKILPLETGECSKRSGEPLSGGGESLCLRTSLPSEPLPPGLAGLEQRDVSPVLLPAVMEEEAERVGLCWFPRKSWYGTVARIGCNRTVVVLLLQEEKEAVGEPLFLTRCWNEQAAGDADMICHVQTRKLFIQQCKVVVSY